MQTWLDTISQRNVILLSWLSFCSYFVPTFTPFCSSQTLLPNKRPSNKVKSWYFFEKSIGFPSSFWVWFKIYSNEGEHVLLTNFSLLVWVIFCFFLSQIFVLLLFHQTFLSYKRSSKTLERRFSARLFSKMCSGLLNNFCDFKNSEINNINVINLAWTEKPLLIFF